MHQGHARRLALALLLGTLAACARIEPPPGGPPDTEPPQLIATVPDSLARLPGFDGDVEFRFDEVISEGGSASQGAGTGDLERLIILSPTTRFPDVKWRRTRITVRPDEGWQPDRVYRVQLLPGVSDLRRNQSNQGTVVTFTTGAPVPETTLEGTVVDWSAGRPAANALVVALLLPDSLPYRGRADSTGRFTLGPIPAGEYLVSGVLDQNRNNRADSREAFDSARVAPGTRAVGELWAFVHDTLPPRIRAVSVRDSLAAAIDLSQPADPLQRLAPDAASLRLLPDSSPVPVVSILPRHLDDSLNAPRTPPADTLAADTAGAGRRPAPPAARERPRAPTQERPTGRPPLSDQLILRTSRPWEPGARYVVEIRGVRNVTGTSADVSGTLVVPERPAPDSLQPGADSIPQPDSVRRAPGKPVKPR